MKQILNNYKFHSDFNYTRWCGKQFRIQNNSFISIYQAVNIKEQFRLGCTGEIIYLHLVSIMYRVKIRQSLLYQQYFGKQGRHFKCKIIIIIELFQETFTIMVLILYYYLYIFAWSEKKKFFFRTSLKRLHIVGKVLGQVLSNFAHNNV